MRQSTGFHPHTRHNAPHLVPTAAGEEREKRKEDTGDGDDRARARESHARFQERALLEISLGVGHPPNQRSELEGSGHDDHGCINNNDSVDRDRRGQLLALFYDSVKSTGGVSAEPCDWRRQGV